MVRHDRVLANEGEPANRVAEAEVRSQGAAEEQAGGERTAPVQEVAVVEEAPAEAPEPFVEDLPATEEAPAQQVTYNYFYDSLAPYGNWVDLPDYGWCWQPSVAVVVPGWRPYLHSGRWIWSDCGWYWQSYYSWGWAPFHYGRWHLASRGWVWVPDRYWGPAWVTWRYYDGYCGWAPLPPGCVYRSGYGLYYGGHHVGFGFSFGLGVDCYSFVPLHGFYTSSPWSYCAPNKIVNQFYGDTTIINNYVVGDNNTIINRGIGTERIERASGTEIRRVALRDAGEIRGETVRAERLTRDGTTLAVYRPNLPPQAATPPENVTRRQQERQREVQRVAQSERAQQAIAAASQPGFSARVSSRGGTTRGESIRPPQVTRRPESAASRTSSAGRSAEPGRPSVKVTRSESRREAVIVPSARDEGTVRRPVVTPTRPNTPNVQRPSVQRTEPNRSATQPGVAIGSGSRSEPTRQLTIERRTVQPRTVTPSSRQPNVVPPTQPRLDTVRPQRPSTPAPNVVPRIPSYDRTAPSRTIEGSVRPQVSQPAVRSAPQVTVPSVQRQEIRSAPQRPTVSAPAPVRSAPSPPSSSRSAPPTRGGRGAER
jgi:hypothetical protein